MSNPFNRIYPKQGRVLLDGGKNSKFERSIIEDNESPDCANVVFTNGAAETRQGLGKLNTAAIGSFAGDGLYTRRDLSGSETMVAFAGGTMWQLGGTSFSTIASAQSVFTAGVRVATAQFENHMYIGNGGVIPYKYDGSVFARHGVYPPTTTATVASNGVGALTASGQYQYKVTYVNSGLVQGDLGPASTTFVISTTSGQNRVSNIPVAPQSYGVASRKLYRNSNGSTTFKLVTTLSDNTTTTYDDNVADSALGATAPTDQGVPPNYSIIVYHQSRLFMNDPSNPGWVWYTELDEPYTVKATNFRVIGDGTSDLVKGLSVYNNALLVTCESSQWLIYMGSTDPADWKTVRVKGALGSKSPFCLLDYKDRQLFPAVQNTKFVGFSAISGDAVAPSTTFLTVSTAGSDLQSERIEPDMFNVSESLQSGISGIVFKNKAWITLPYGSSATNNNRVYVMDFSRSNLSKNNQESWVPFTGTKLQLAQFTVYGGNLYGISAKADGFVYKMESGLYADDGDAIDSYLWTKEFSGYAGEENYNKDFRYANLLIEKTGNYYMNVNSRVDSDAGDGTAQQVSLTPGGTLWGSFLWGTGTWGGAKSQEDYTLDLGATSGKRIQFKFSNQNTANQRFKVHGINFTYNLKGRR